MSIHIRLEPATGFSRVYFNMDNPSYDQRIIRAHLIPSRGSNEAPIEPSLYIYDGNKQINLKGYLSDVEYTKFCNSKRSIHISGNPPALMVTIK